LPHGRARHGRARGREAALPAIGAARRLGRLERHARAARIRRARREARGGALRLPHRARARLARRRARRPGRDRLHCRHRRARRADPRAHLPPGGVARRRARSAGERRARAAHQHRLEPCPRVGDPDQRRADDRAPHARTAFKGMFMAQDKRHDPILAGKKALVVGIANEHSIAYGCASAFRSLGAELAITYLNEKAKPHVEPLARRLEAPIFLPLNVEQPGELEALFDALKSRWGRLDILVHSIAFAPKEDLQGGLIDCSAEGFKRAMDVSVHSFIRMAKLAAPLMSDGGTMFAMSYHGAQKVVANYNVMGPVKAALEAACRYLAYELGEKRIRVHPISPGPLKTRAASGLKDFDLLLNEAASRAPIGELVDIDDVGFTCAYLATPYARRLTGQTTYVDGGVNIMG